MCIQYVCLWLLNASVYNVPLWRENCLKTVLTASECYYSGMNRNTRGSHMWHIVNREPDKDADPALQWWRESQAGCLKAMT